jgi:hypothetical protein
MFSQLLGAQADARPADAEAPVAVDGRRVLGASAVDIEIVPLCRFGYGVLRGARYQDRTRRRCCMRTTHEEEEEEGSQTRVRGFLY